MAIKGVKSSETYVTEQKAPKIRKKRGISSKNKAPPESRAEAQGL